MSNVNRLKYIIALFAVFTSFSNSLSAQKKSNAGDNIISNVYDSVSFKIRLGIMRPGRDRPLYFMYDSVLAYIDENLQGVDVSIIRYPDLNPGKIRKSLGIVNVGNFKCYRELLPLKEKLVADGFTVPYIHGYRCQANAHADDLRRLTAKRCNEPEYLKNETDTATFPWDSVFFKVKMGTYEDGIPNSVWSYIKNDLYDVFRFIEKFGNGPYQISLGLHNKHFYKCYADAIPLLEKVVSAGYSDAYIAAYMCNKELDVETAKRIKEKRCN